MIAEPDQELADTLDARTFALAQQTDDELMMNICSTCQGAQASVKSRWTPTASTGDDDADLADEGLWSSVA